MARGKFDWVQDTRGELANVASFDDWDNVAAFHNHCIEAPERSCIPMFVENATAIYAHLRNQAKQARRTAILIARHQRLADLLAMHEASNVIDFYLLKFPAWLASEYLHRRTERRTHNV